MQTVLRLARFSLHRRRATASDAVSWYLHSVGNTKVLTRNEEVQLGAIIHLGSTVSQAQRELETADGSEASLDEVRSFVCTSGTDIHSSDRQLLVLSSTQRPELNRVMVKL